MQNDQSRNQQNQNDQGKKQQGQGDQNPNQQNQKDQSRSQPGQGNQDRNQQDQKDQGSGQQGGQGQGDQNRNQQNQSGQDQKQQNQNDRNRSPKLGTHRSAALIGRVSFTPFHERRNIACPGIGCAPPVRQHRDGIITGLPPRQSARPPAPRRCSRSTLVASQQRCAVLPALVSICRVVDEDIG